MSLAALPVGPVIPVSDLDHSLEFYEGALGLSGEAIPARYLLRCGSDTVIYLLADTDYAGRADWPLASFATDRLEQVVDELHDRGVELVRFDDGPQRTDERGIAELDGVRIAWVLDPDRQVLSIFQPL